MSKKDEALKLALEALEEIHPGNMTPMAEGNWNKAITAIREALAEQPAQGCEFCSHPLYAGTKCKHCGREQPAQQEPPTVAELLCVCGAEWEWRNRDWELVAIPPAQRKPLTNEQALQMSYKHEWLTKLGMREAYRTGIRDAESAHGIKGDA